MTSPYAAKASCACSFPITASPLPATAALKPTRRAGLVTKEGYLIDPGITVPQNTSSVSISSQGLVAATLPGSATPQTLGQLTMSRFINPVGLESIGDNYYVETAGSGAPIDGTPGNDGFGNLLQGYLEDSNVNAVTEIASMIQAQRAYELNSKVIQGADSMLTATATMFRA